MKVRQSILAGSWYPDTAGAVKREIDDFIGDPAVRSVAGKPLVGGIVPHAGWYFSGAIACNVIRSLTEGPAPDAVILFGMHLHSTSPCHIMKEGGWETPLGVLEIEETITGELCRRFNFRVETTERFTRDNTIEVQLPFVKHFFPEARIVPIGVPPSDKALEIARAAAEIARENNLTVRVIGSTDLTHYGVNYGFMPEGRGQAALDWVRQTNDKKVIDAMLAMDPSRVIQEALANHNACCGGAAAAAIEAARALGAEKAETIAYATSHDKHPGNSFVGYVGIVF